MKTEGGLGMEGIRREQGREAAEEGTSKSYEYLRKCHNETHHFVSSL